MWFSCKLGFSVVTGKHLRNKAVVFRCFPRPFTESYSTAHRRGHPDLSGVDPIPSLCSACECCVSFPSDVFTAVPLHKVKSDHV